MGPDPGRDGTQAGSQAFHFLDAKPCVRPALIVQAWDAHAATLMKRQAAPPPLCALRCTVVHWEKNGAVMDLPLGGLPLELQPNASGALLFFDQVRGADGIPRSSYFGQSVIDLTVESELYRTAKVRDLALPRPSEPLQIRLAPNYRYPFRATKIGKGETWPTLIRGRLAARDQLGIERGVANARVRLAGQAAEPDYETDHTGWFVLVLPPDSPAGPLGIEIYPPGAANPAQTIERTVRTGDMIDLKTITLSSV